MSKNNALISAQKEIARIKQDYDKMLFHKANSITAQIYAAFALVLSKQYDWTDDDIEILFGCTQALWVEYADETETMIDLCERETGICVAPIDEDNL